MARASELLDEPRRFCESARQVERCKAELDSTGICVIPDFIRAEAVEASRRNALESLEKAYQIDYEFEYDDVYSNPSNIPLSALPENHPRHTRSLTRIKFIAKDLINANDPVRVLHSSPWMSDFIAAVMGMTEAFPSPCPLSGCIFTVAEPGELQDWHFDSNDFIVTLMLQAPSAGGQFEFVPGLREPEGDDDFEAIAGVFAGEQERVESVDAYPGTLTLFKGRYNFHRAAPVESGTARIMAILSFDPTPDYVAPPEHLRLFYGRSQAIA